MGPELAALNRPRRDSQGALRDRDIDAGDFGIHIDLMLHPVGDTVYLCLTEPDTTLGNPYFFTGRRLDVIPDLPLGHDPRDTTRQIYYYRARNYDPFHGRFMQRDPSGYVDGMNLYEYAKSNPAKYVDPTGWFDCDHVGGAKGWFKFKGWEDERYMYTCRCGWLDREHVRDWMKAFDIIRDQLQLELSAGAVRTHIGFTYISSPLNTAKAYYVNFDHAQRFNQSVADLTAAIAFDLSVGVETTQLFFGYSAEDLPSNVLGISLARAGVGQLAQTVAQPWIEKHCGKILSQCQAREVCENCSVSGGKVWWSGLRANTKPGLATRQCNPHCKESAPSQLFSVKSGFLRVLPLTRLGFKVHDVEDWSLFRGDASSYRVVNPGHPDNLSEADLEQELRSTQ